MTPETASPGLIPLPGGQARKFMKTNFTLCAAGIFLSLSFLCSCATEPPVRGALPADVPINPDAGRGNWLTVTLQLESGQKLPFIVDTGAGATVLNKPLAPKLGKRLDTIAGHQQRRAAQKELGRRIQAVGYRLTPMVEDSGAEALSEFWRQ